MLVAMAMTAAVLLGIAIVCFEQAAIEAERAARMDARQRNEELARPVLEDRMMAQQAGDILVSAVVKGIERYVFIYAESRYEEAISTAGRWAHEPELSFTWYDAAVLSKAIRGQVEAKMIKGQCSRFNDG